jgi:hypothetical protein
MDATGFNGEEGKQLEFAEHSTCYRLRVQKRPEKIGCKKACICWRIKCHIYFPNFDIPKLEADQLRVAGISAL